LTAEDIKAVVVKALRGVAPDIDAATLDPDESWREQTDLDSMDFLNLMIALHRALGIEIPEADYPRLSSLNAAVRYLADRLQAAGH
jgi:acyl carrier protein